MPDVAHHKLRAPSIDPVSRVGASPLTPSRPSAERERGLLRRLLDRFRRRRVHRPESEDPGILGELEIV